MKKGILIFLGLVIAGVFPLQAQVADTVYQKREVIIIDEAPEEVVLENAQSGRAEATIIKIRKRSQGPSLRFFTRIGLGYNGLVENLNRLKLPEGAEWMDLESKSINFNLRLLEYRNFNRNFGFQTGLDLEVANFRFSRDMIPRVNRVENYVVEGPLDYHLKKSKLVNCYLNVPVIFRLGMVYGGVVGGWRWNSYIKEKSSQYGKERHRGNLNLRNFHYGYTVGLILFKTVDINATYYPQSIFKSNQGPDVRQVNLGISFIY